MDHQDRLEGHLPSHLGPSQHQEILSVRDIGKDLSFSSATIWAIDGAKRVHQIVGSGSPVIEVTAYAPPFWPPFFRSLENLYSFDPYILATMRKMSYFDPYFSSKLSKMYSFNPPFLTLVAFRVEGRCWASLSKTWPSTPPREETIHLLQSLGWTINWKKSLLEPSRVLEYLGLHFNLEQALISPPSSILETLTSVISRLSTSTMSARKITSINSRISHFAPFIHHGRLQLCFLPLWIKQHWSQHAQPWDSQIQLNQEYISHLHWFCRPEVLQGLPLHTPEPNLFFFTDASLTGWGSIWQDQQIMWQWSLLEQIRHIKWLELEAVCLAICHWGPHWFKQTVRVNCDNSTAVAYICKQRRTHSLSLFHKTLELFQLLDKFAIILVPTHLPVACNITVDVLSRLNSPSPTEWRLPLGILNSILCLRDSADGYVRGSRKQGDTDLCFTLPGRQGLGSRRPLHIVG